MECQARRHSGGMENSTTLAILVRYPSRQHCIDKVSDPQNQGIGTVRRAALLGHPARRKAQGRIYCQSRLTQRGRYRVVSLWRIWFLRQVVCRRRSQFRDGRCARRVESVGGTQR